MKTLSNITNFHIERNMNTKQKYWDDAFKNAYVWPEHLPKTLTISNRKPPAGRNIFQEDKKEIFEAASNNGFVFKSKGDEVSVWFRKEK